MKIRDFGTTPKGEMAHLYSFENNNGIIMEVSDFGAALVSLIVPDKNGKKIDISLGYDSPSEYINGSGTFFGSTVGRNANRIRNASFELNGKMYKLDSNKGSCNLHSGCDFYSYRIWSVKETGGNYIVFSLHSDDMDQGYPAALDLDVRYTLTDADTIEIDYLGVPDGDTIINITNHSYFNLNGHNSGDILCHELYIDADEYTVNDADGITTGEILRVENTPMDFRKMKKIGMDINADYKALILAHGYDHNWCLNNNGEYKKVAEAIGNKSGVKLEVFTDLIGMQLYTANYIENEKGKDGAVYQRHQGVCFETQFFPDAIHHAHFKQPIFNKDEVFKSKTAFRLSVI